MVTQVRAHRRCHAGSGSALNSTGSGTTRSLLEAADRVVEDVAELPAASSLPESPSEAALPR